MTGDLGGIIAPDKIVDKDAQVHGYEGLNKMTYALSVDPPEGNGSPVSLDMLQRFLKERRVVYGLDEEALQLLADGLYNKPLEIARGTPVCNGVDGSIKELFPREIKPTFKEREDGTINFKEMNLVVNVEEGQTLCEITLPTEGKEGRNVYGSPIKPRRGLAPVVPAGENTKVIEEGRKLVAAKTGSLVFQKGKFRVEPVLKVDNVDNSTGNLRFNGDVVVKGFVQEGFEIHSTGNVRIEGSVEGASIYADGSILLVNGINGMGRGILQAGKEVTSKYIENCSIRAGGDVKAETIINSTVETDGNIEISGKRGRIAGGKLTVFGSINSRRVGSRSAVQTVIVLGSTPSMMREKMDLENRLKELNDKYEEMRKSLDYLERLDKAKQITTPERKKALNQMRLQAPVLKMKRAKLMEQKAELEERLQGVAHCMLVSQKVYPPTKIMIGNASMVIQDITENCRIYRNSQGEISVGKA
ncbi:MAG: DUF342 domain-containing protein [Oscillospiraceae bacterium]|nr:DUF342 domain-containing protein [Oscillospiraceae bacterium]MCI9362789.1 DUF342 domain-containing protein [Oscillospiraceae bacterium]